MLIVVVKLRSVRAVVGFNRSVVYIGIAVPEASVFDVPCQ